LPWRLGDAVGQEDSPTRVGCTRALRAERTWYAKSALFRVAPRTCAAAAVAKTGRACCYCWGLLARSGGADRLQPERSRDCATQGVGREVEIVGHAFGDDASLADPDCADAGESDSRRLAPERELARTRSLRHRPVQTESDIRSSHHSCGGELVL